MDRTEAYQAAKRRVEARMGFYFHLFVYVAVMLLLVAINLISSPQTLWFQWPMMGWGVAVALHGLVVFLLPNRFTATEEKIEKEMNRAQRGTALKTRGEETKMSQE